MKVVSLVPSVTETLLAWGIVPIACTKFCEQPRLPTVGGTKTPNLDAILALQPDLVVLDDQENRKSDYDALVGSSIPVHALSIKSIADLDEQLPVLAARVGAQWQPVGDAGRCSTFSSVFVPIWRRPWMALGTGTYGASMLSRLGLTLAPAGSSPYSAVDPAGLGNSALSLIVVPSEPYRFQDRHLRELAPLAPIMRVDGRDLFWWGSRTAQALLRLEDQIGSATSRAGQERLRPDGLDPSDIRTGDVAPIPIAALEAHRRALAAGDPMYIDPITGLHVMTARSLAARPCCGNACRHCPWTDNVDGDDLQNVQPQEGGAKE